VQEISTGQFRVDWATGESMTVDTNGAYINESIALTAADAGNVQGLLGPDDGNPGDDLQLPDGTVIPQPITASRLYGEYADDWRITDATSLLTYPNGQNTETFSDASFPQDQLNLLSLPANVITAAEQVVENAGVTDPALLQAGVTDLLATGDPNSVVASANVQQQGIGLTPAVISLLLPLTDVGVVADEALALESPSDTIAVDYTVYLTTAGAQPSTVDYSVTAPGSDYLPLADVVPGTGSGSVTFAAGQTSAEIAVDLPAGVLGSEAEANLQITVTPTGGEAAIGATAQTLIVNPTPTAGVSPEVVLQPLAGEGVLTGSGASYVLNLGSVAQGAAAPYANLGVANNATGLADNLFGGFTINDDGALMPGTGESAFVNTGFDSFGDLPAGHSDVEPVITLKTDTTGTFTETIVLDPTDSNYSGYSAPMNDITLMVEGTVTCFCRGTRILTERGEIAVEFLKRGDLVLTTEGVAKPISWLGRRTISAAFADPIRCWPIRVRAGALGDNIPCRDLRLSPDHALLVEDNLIHAGALVNGTSITRETSVPRTFVYYHVELEDHSLILAENAPAETFVDNVDRLGFDNWAEYEALYPSGKPIEEMNYPRAKARRQVPMKVRAILDARAEELGYTAAAVA
jgi:Hint domain